MPMRLVNLDRSAAGVATPLAADPQRIAAVLEADKQK
jgi:hypothetical protein